MIAPGTTFKCVVEGFGSHHRVTLKRGYEIVADSAPVFAFRECDLACAEDTYPDSQCVACVYFDAPDSFRTKELTMADFVSSFEFDMLHGQYTADTIFLQIAELYKDTQMEKFPLPRYMTSDVVANMNLIITGTEPLTLSPVSAEVAMAGGVHTMCSMHMEVTMDTISWTRSNVSGNWRLDL
jgi:hypothetical protein